METEFAARCRAALLAERTPEGFWVGELSPSALSTATAVFALHLHDPQKHAALIRAGLGWLTRKQNPDGGFGDTPISFSNISTTCLCWAALSLADNRMSAERAEAWICNSAGTLEPAPLAKVIADRYGKDRTFSVPILTMLALAGKLGPDPWRLIPQLPFELAALPFWFFRIVQLPVVSYALPALIAIGRVRHARRPTWIPLTRVLRNLAKATTLRKLREIQPGTGGYLEATPLTSFVVMSLLGAGIRGNPVVDEGIRFLIESVRPDGSWPIDTDLSTWVTTLSINALGTVDERGVREWLLKQQYRVVHPFTKAAPGGWAWTDLPGGVPDADDTPGALMALAKLGEPTDTVLSAAAAGCEWLLNLQNRDGGIPTFCKGWTGLPFDRSSNDLTAHTLRACLEWRDQLPSKLQLQIDHGVNCGLAYLLKTQRPDGAWAPLWFGNQHAADIENLTYGTSRVLRLGAALPRGSFDRGIRYLSESQNADGGWGGRAGTPSSIEETALALDAFAEVPREQAHDHAVAYLRRATHEGTHFPPSPIGFYFANLWYYEKLYPLIFTVAALERMAINTSR